MDTLSLTEIADMAGGRLVRGSHEASASIVSKDTRSLPPGSLYLALRGASFDGHAFVAQAAQAGAVGAIVDKVIVGDLPENFALIEVGDTQKGLQTLAESWRRRLTLKVICITGSSGKTSTKDFTKAVMAEKFSVTSTVGNLNNHIGLPLSILEATSSDEIAVWEVGMNHPGEIAPLAALARPDLAIITNIGTAHIENLGSRNAIAQEKGALAESLTANGILVLREEDDYSTRLALRTKGKVVRAGFSGGSVRASQLRPHGNGTRFVVQSGDRSCEMTLPVLGTHMVGNALLAIAAGLEMGLFLEDCARGLENILLTKGRVTLKQLGELQIIDDSYNANPDSMLAALDTLKSLDVNGLRIAVLGKMGELGDHAAVGYARVGSHAAHTADVLLTVGEEAKAMAMAAEQSGLKEVHRVADNAEAWKLLGQLGSAGDAILVKGSRSARMEEIINGMETCFTTSTK